MAYVAGFTFGEVPARVDAAGVAETAIRDRLGSTVGWQDAVTGVVTERVRRDAYGVQMPLPAVVVPFGYTGHTQDPTGLIWGRARCMAPKNGAWTSEDPVHTEGRYGYVRGRASFGVDMTGTMEAAVFAKSSCVGAFMALAFASTAAAQAAGMLREYKDSLEDQLYFRMVLAGQVEVLNRYSAIWGAASVVVLGVCALGK